MNHYTYRINYEDGKSYIGVRSCKHSIEEDYAYIGSSKYTPNHLVKNKEILSTFVTREEAVRHEMHLHQLYDVVVSDLFYNKSKQTSTGFDTTGRSVPLSQEHCDKIKLALTGRVRSPEECANISAGKKGKSRKPHSEETRAKQSESRIGVDGYMKGQTYTQEERQSKYASRVRYPEPYYWVNQLTGNCEYMTCVEMGYKYVSGPKPSQRFTNILRGISKSYKGWVLGTGKE